MKPKIKKMISNNWKMLGLLSVILLVSNIIFISLYLSSIIELKSERLNSNSNNQELIKKDDVIDVVKKCEYKEFQTYVENSLVSDIKIENDTSKIVIIAPQYEDINGVIVGECALDVTDNLVRSLKTTNENIQFISNLTVLENNLIAFNFSGSIYTYHLGSFKTKAIVSREMFKGTQLYSKEGIGVEIIGPYVHSYTQSGKIYFYTDLSWGCEDTGSAYCKSMEAMAKELKDKKLLGFFEYNYLTDKRVFLK